MRTSWRLLFATLAFGTMGAAAIAPSRAEVIALSADLSAQAEVPPAASPARGTADVRYDTVTKVLAWRVEYSGLSAPLSAAHFHGTATPATNAGVLVPIVLATQPSPLVGQATITDAQAADLLAGRWYINLHTPVNPAGEIRGQVVRK
jgi:hypothetical protein